ncbi:MAG: glutamate-1-semialdehyde 2,1-aminomutase [Clostridiales bacterium]|jgi:glutamate-1-semialdehyde 2,1-aminomutase|nr:glutamate-1-semialdehyde 2,1-aminomutase [Clostridiales bacterium]
MTTRRSEDLFEQAKQVTPGGVNSPVRAFHAVGGNPVYIDHADGAYLYDVEGRRYLDYVMSWGAAILGHNDADIREAVIAAAGRGLSYGANTEAELWMARIITEITGVEMVRMVNSGTEAVMSAVRLARGFTKRDKLIKFEGGYHGHSDSMLVKAGSGALTAGTPDSEGVPAAVAADTLTASYNDAASAAKLFEANPGQIAALIVEPVCANQGVITPREGFLADLRALCDQNNSLLIFDEVITGFRLGLAGAQGAYGVKADLVTYGKIMGGGLPVGAFGGRGDIMRCLAPLGGVYQAGTLSGNPVAMAAGMAALTKLRREPAIYDRLNSMGDVLREGLRQILKDARLTDAATVDGTASLCCLFVGRERYRAFFQKMLSRGIYLAPSQFEAMFISAAHTMDQMRETLEAAAWALK